MGQEFFSDSENNLMWMKRGRGFYALDVESKKSGHTVASGDGDQWIHNAFVADPEKKIFFIELASPPPDPKTYLLYDLLTDTDVFTSPEYDGVMFPLSSSLLLYCEFYEKFGKSMLKWQVVDTHFNKQKDNKLTKRLTKMQIYVWAHSKTFHFNKRMMFGTGKNPLDKYSLIYYTIRWDEKLEDIKIEPIILQLPKKEKGRLGADFVLSHDGNWVKTVLKPHEEGIIPDTLIFYHASGIYPQGLSMPITGGYTNRDNPGAFMDHEEWGPCYVEMDPDVPGKLFIYKLNQGMDILRDAVVGE
ncbi:MAG: hypothetical protein GY754_28690 [bacterium]|nr:hypothetical protein [bacterium]